MLRSKVHSVGENSTPQGPRGCSGYRAERAPQFSTSEFVQGNRPGCKRPPLIDLAEVFSLASDLRMYTLPARMALNPFTPKGRNG